MLSDRVWSSRLGRRAWTAAQGIRARLPHRPFPAILNYHRIAEESFDPWGVAITPAHFREHLEWLSKNRTVLRLREFADLHRRRRLPRDAVAVTLDDGYACNSQVAAPLLDEFRIPATFFIPVDVISRGEPFWWDELEHIVLEQDAPFLSMEGDRISLGEKTSGDRQWLPGSGAGTARQRVFLDLHIRLSRKKTADLEKAMAELRTQATSVHPEASTKRPMTPAQVRQCASDYVEFGSHSLNHPWLPNLDRAAQRHEICGSVDQCRSLTGSRPSAFAYPYGMFDAQSEMLVEQAGFDCACATGNLAVSRISRTFALPRVHVGNWDAAGLQRVLAEIRRD